jgi:hypothetical protein
MLRDLLEMEIVDRIDDLELTLTQEEPYSGYYQEVEDELAQLRDVLAELIF